MFRRYSGVRTHAYTARLPYDWRMSKARGLGAHRALEKLAISSAMANRLVSGKINQGTMWGQPTEAGWGAHLSKIVQRGTQGGQFRGDRQGLLDGLKNMNQGARPLTGRQAQISMTLDRAAGNYPLGHEKLVPPIEPPPIAAPASRRIAGPASIGAADATLPRGRGGVIG